MKIIEALISDLLPYENNPRYNESAIDGVAESIKAFGFKVPIIIDSNNVIVAGHTRLLASKKLGLEKVPCIVTDDLNEEQVKAFRLADNKVSELSTWDFSKLEKELSEITMDMSLFNFDEVEKTSDIDIDSFFEQAELKEKPIKKIRCPHCGEYFELEK